MLKFLTNFHLVWKDIINKVRTVSISIRRLSLSEFYKNIINLFTIYLGYLWYKALVEIKNEKISWFEKNNRIYYYLKNQKKIGGVELISLLFQLLLKQVSISYLKARNETVSLLNIQRCPYFGYFFTFDLDVV